MPQQPRTTPAAAALPVPVNQAVQEIDLSAAGGKWNVLGPLSIVSAREGLKILASVVKVSTNPDDGDVYPAPGTRWVKDKSGKFKPTKVALAKNGLLKISEAKGIIWDTPNCHKLDDAPPCNACKAAADLTGAPVSCQHNIGFQAVGGWIDYTGRFLKSPPMSKYWCWDEELLEVERTYRKQLADGKITEDELPGKVREEFQKRFRDRLSLAQTKAIERVIRLVGLKPAYDVAEADRGFLVPRIEPDESPEEVRRRAMLSQTQLFGPPTLAALPGVDFAQATVVDNGEPAAPATATAAAEEAEEIDEPDTAHDPASDELREQIITLAREHFGDTLEGVAALQEFLKTGWDAMRVRDLTDDQKVQALETLQEMTGKKSEEAAAPGKEPWADA